MNKNNKVEKKKRDYSGFGAVVVALLAIIVLISMSYTAFITVVGVGGRTNLYLALPSMFAVGGIIISAVVYTAVTVTKRK